MKLARWLIGALIALGLLAARPGSQAGFAMARLDAAGDPPPIEEYWQQVNDALAAVRQARTLPVDERALVLARAAERLAPITSVQLTKEQSAPVDNTALIAALHADSPDLDRLEARLAALAQAGRNWPHFTPHPQAFDKLAQVLARPEFQPAERTPSLLEQWWDEFNRWLDRWLARLFFANEAQALGIDWVIVLVGALTLAGLGLFFWRNVRAHLVREAALAHEAAGQSPLSASAAARQARALAAGADYRQAMRYMYLAALLVLDERGVLRYDQAMTNREVLRRAEQSADPRLAQALAPVVDTFDQVWYGFTPVDDQAYQTYTQQIEHIAKI